MKTTDKYIFFWTAKDIYSNFYPFSFTHRGISFHCSEQAVMWRKAKLFGAENIANKILQAQDAQSCKNLGRSREIPFVEEIWVKNRLDIYKQVLYDKFKCEPLLQEILKTEDKKFVEASPYDGIWGIKLHEKDPRIHDESQWQGQNLLGKCLDEVKRELKRKYGQRD